MSKSVTDLFYWKWRTQFYNAVRPRQIYEGLPLLHKLKGVLFFPKLEVEVLPSHHFWTKVEQMLNTYPLSIDEVSFEHACEKFAASDVNFLREALLDVLLCFKNFPQVFIDLYKFYPKFNLKFEEIEFFYIDFWSQTPKVLASLLSELLVRDAPFREVFVTDFKWYAWGEAAKPPPQGRQFTEAQLQEALVSYFVGGARFPVFVEIINLYLNARPKVLAECTQALLNLGSFVNEDSLAQCFVGYYIFKGISLEALLFCAVNGDVCLDPFKAYRDEAIQKWEASTEEERQAIIKHNQRRLELISSRVAQDAAMTHEEKVARVEAREAAWKKRAEEAKAFLAANPDWRRQP